MCLEGGEPVTSYLARQHWKIALTWGQTCPFSVTQQRIDARRKRVDLARTKQSFRVCVGVCLFSFLFPCLPFFLLRFLFVVLLTFLFIEFILIFYFSPLKIISFWYICTTSRELWTRFRPHQQMFCRRRLFLSHINIFFRFFFSNNLLFTFL
jgi:hypothetical protein